MTAEETRCRNLCDKALELIKRVMKLNLILGHIEWNVGSTKIDLTDGKLYDAKQAPNSFEVGFSNDIYDEEKDAVIDELAEIPARINPETKITLRIAYLIWQEFDNNRFAAFVNYVRTLSYEERRIPQNLPNSENVRNWYANLKLMR